MLQDWRWVPAGAGARIISPREGYPGASPVSRSRIVIDRQCPTMTSGARRVRMCSYACVPASSQTKNQSDRVLDAPEVGCRQDAEPFDKPELGDRPELDRICRRVFDQSVFPV